MKFHSPSAEKLAWFALVMLLFAVSLSSYSWVRSSHLSLPLPVSLAGLNILLCILAVVVIPGSALLFLRNENYSPAVFQIISHIFTLMPVAILTLTLVYCIPTSLRSCAIQDRWQSLFQAKNAGAIRSIQDTLRCCGLNSMSDRAWPFPSSTVDARECERTQGWDKRCLDGWTRLEVRTAGTLAASTVASWVLILLLISIVQLRDSFSEYPESNSNARINDVSTRLLNGPEDPQEGPSEEVTTTARERYSD